MAMLLPTLPVPAVKLGATTVSVGTSEEPVRAVTLRLTQPFNITGHPAITMPCGLTNDGLPAGAQLVGMNTLDAALGRERHREHPSTPHSARSTLSRLGTPAGVYHRRIASCGPSSGASTGSRRTDTTATPPAVLEQWVEDVMRDSQAFFTPPPTSDFEFIAAGADPSGSGEAGHAAVSERATSRRIPRTTSSSRAGFQRRMSRRSASRRGRGRAVLVLPQWNSDAGRTHRPVAAAGAGSASRRCV